MIREKIAYGMRHTCGKRPRDNLGQGNICCRTISNKITLDSRLVHEKAKKNPKFASEALRVPPQPDPLQYKASFDIGSNHGGNAERDTNLENYLMWRKWDPTYINNPWTKILLSHALTFPLTLATNASHFIPTNIQEDPGEKLKPININLCCVGSRAEANLPDDFWREYLIAANLFEHHKGVDLRRFPNPINWNIDFIGPDTPHQQVKNRQIVLSDDHAHGCVIRHKSLNMNYYSDFLHNHVLKLYKSNGNRDEHSRNNLTSTILSKWDGYILFNPGLNHPNLKKSWKPTMEFILKTNRKILVTSHSPLDGRRDLDVLMNSVPSLKRNIADASSKIKYKMNPFASRMTYEDICHVKESNSDETKPHIVRPNHSTLCL